jgi:hypothetical protein
MSAPDMRPMGWGSGFDPNQKSQDLADIICISINTGNTSATPASAANALRELAAAA